jgi:hypothetical protein
MNLTSLLQKRLPSGVKQSSSFERPFSQQSRHEKSRLRFIRERSRVLGAALHTSRGAMPPLIRELNETSAFAPAKVVATKSELASLCLHFAGANGCSLS